MADLVYQVQLGPRIPGSQAHSQVVKWLADSLTKSGWSVSEQNGFRRDHPYVNIIAKRGEGKPWTVIGAHYDSRLWADQDPDQAKRHDPVPGANDGASGVAILTELARDMPSDLPGQIWLVFFDIEVNGEIPTWDWLLGSQAFVDGLPSKPDAAVILDMIGDANLNILKERNSDQEINQEIAEQKELINLQNQKIAAKEQEISSLAELESKEMESADTDLQSGIEKEQIRVGKAAEYLESHETTDVEPLQKKADEVANMQSYLREWDRMLDIRDGKLATKKAYSNQLTNIINIARNKPAELLKQHKLPIKGISVDENSMIRINGTLLDGLSDGEKLEAAFGIALQRIGELRVICLDGFEKLNESEQKKIVKLCEDNDIQTFATITKDTVSGEFEVKDGLQ
jgi:CTP-dependent riboflavin kinase